MKLRYYHTKVPNFGDDLNAKLWPHFAPDLFDDSTKEAFVGIGTIIGFPCAPQTKLNVFSSGAGNDPLSRWSGLDVTYWCVRGPLSARHLGLAPDIAISDGAVITPLAEGFPRKRVSERGVLIIPHWESLNDPSWNEIARLTGFELLDPRGSPESVIGRIAEARCVLTESLHGAILADTYGVEWAAFATTGNFQISKWLDWAMSCGHKLSVTIVPPPTAQGILKYGRPGAPFGDTIGITEGAAMEEMRRRTSEPKPPRLQDRAKGWIKQTGVMSRFLNMSPERTAQALIDLSSRLTAPSRESTVKTLQERMLDRLEQLRRSAR
ncbi:polysaccharide pyruvyl transferase family protein [Methylobacterium sp. 37f]|uniref:polysaccharide pyruvyl transferase family protein n=1 Tax=Methylobacterium sp. 37f TaxID=2817058 RepID=UPI001FFC7691|nr:polysaccharide pyruvyl transferase family protein [Methylobacterium sp. 37f]MCK2055579.1 polysaccharide pyruvyl transferase family protein [Methylobacterium sp. 37f]